MAESSKYSQEFFLANRLTQEEKQTVESARQTGTCSSYSNMTLCGTHELESECMPNRIREASSGGHIAHNIKKALQQKINLKRMNNALNIKDFQFFFSPQNCLESTDQCKIKSKPASLIAESNTASVIAGTKAVSLIAESSKTFLLPTLKHCQNVTLAGKFSQEDKQTAVTGTTSTDSNISLSKFRTHESKMKCIPNVRRGDRYVVGFDITKELKQEVKLEVLTDVDRQAQCSSQTYQESVHSSQVFYEGNIISIQTEVEPRMGLHESSAEAMEKIRAKRENDNFHLKWRRENETMEQKKARQERNCLNQRERRACQTIEEITAMREKNRLSQRQRRACLTNEEITAIREKNRLSQRRRRACQTVEEIRDSREKNRLSQRRRRACQTIEEIKVRREKDKLRKRWKNTCESPEETNARHAMFIILEKAKERFLSNTDFTEELKTLIKKEELDTDDETNGQSLLHTQSTLLSQLYQNLKDAVVKSAYSKKKSLKFENHDNLSKEVSYETLQSYLANELNVVKEQDICLLNGHKQMLQCNICFKKFMSKSGLRNHQNYHTGKKPYKCTTCNSQYMSKASLYRHEETHFLPTEKSFQCEFCGKTFGRKLVFFAHEKAHLKEKPVKCPHCNKVFKNSHVLKVHERTHSGEKPYKCEMCNKRFSQRSSVALHVLGHSAVKVFKCDTCSKQFYAKSGLAQHKMTHMQPFICETCGKKFSFLSYLKLHQRIHTGDKPFQCQICHKRFSQRFYLKKHLQTHSDAFNSKPRQM